MQGSWSKESLEKEKEGQEKVKTKKRKITKKGDGSWDTSDLYRNTSKFPFNIEWMKVFNKAEGRDQIVFLYLDKKTKKIIKHRVLR